MADIWSPNNPGISGLKELTSGELAIVQQIAGLGTPAGNRLLGYDSTDGSYEFFNIGTGLSYDHSTHTLSSTGGSGGGDFSTNTSTSVASEIVLFADTSGKVGKRSTGSGLALLTSGVLSTVTAPSGTVVGTSDTQTLTNKDLTSGTNTFPTFNQNTTGSAAKWTTARLLAGNSVDGSANVAFANKFIVQGTTDTGLSAAQFLGALGTGIVKNTTTTGVLSIAIAADFPTLNQSTSGNAATATALATGRTISISGDLTYTSPSFDGSGNVTAAGTLATVNSNVGSFTYASITVNGKGLVTAASSGSAPLINPMTTLGDIIYENVTPAATRLAGNTTTAKQYLSQTGNGTISAAPAWATIAAADIGSGAALTKTDDTNVTLTLGGTPTTALLAATSLTLGWTGTLAISRGGTGAGTKAAAFDALSPMTTSGDIIYGGASGTGTRLAKGTDGNVLTLASGLPTWAAPSSSGITWTEVTGTTQTAAVNNGYILNNASQVTLTLPSTAAVGSIVRVAGKGAGGWKVALNASGIIHFDGTDTTTGTGGSLASTVKYDAVEMVCIVANNEWVVISSIGNITIV